MVQSPNIEDATRQGNEVRVVLLFYQKHLGAVRLVVSYTPAYHGRKNTVVNYVQWVPHTMVYFTSHTRTATGDICYGAVLCPLGETPKMGI